MLKSGRGFTVSSWSRTSSKFGVSTCEVRDESIGANNLLCSRPTSAPRPLPPAGCALRCTMEEPKMSYGYVIILCDAPKNNT